MELMQMWQLKDYSKMEKYHEWLKSGSQKKYQRETWEIFREAVSPFSIGILPGSTALTMLMETCPQRTELTLTLYLDMVIKDALSGSNYINFFFIV